MLHLEIDIAEHRLGRLVFERHAAEFDALAELRRRLAGPVPLRGRQVEHLEHAFRGRDGGGHDGRIIRDRFDRRHQPQTDREERDQHRGIERGAEREARPDHEDQDDHEAAEHFAHRTRQTGVALCPEHAFAVALGEHPEALQLERLGHVSTHQLCRGDDLPHVARHLATLRRELARATAEAIDHRADNEQQHGCEQQGEQRQFDGEAEQNNDVDDDHDDVL